MRFIHISDIHLSKDNLTDFRNFYLDALKKDLKNFKDSHPVDLILLTGDLIDKGGSSFAIEDTNNAYDLFEQEFIIPLITLLEIDKNQVLFIPGNHDIERSEIDAMHEIGLATTISTIANANLKLEETRKTFSPSNNRLQKFKNFEKQYHSNNREYVYSNNESLFVYEKDNSKIGFLLINDSWRCSEGLKPEHHFIGTNQLMNAKNFFSEKSTDLNIVLFHHPLEVLNSAEQNEIKNILQKFDFELVLLGEIMPVIKVLCYSN